MPKRISKRSARSSNRIRRELKRSPISAIDSINRIRVYAFNCIGPFSCALTDNDYQYPPRGSRMDHRGIGGNNWRGLESGGIIGWLRSPGVLGGVRSRPSNLKLAILSTPCAIIGSSSFEESTLRPLGCSLSTSYHRPDQSPDIAYQAIRERSVIPIPIPCQSPYL